MTESPLSKSSTKLPSIRPKSATKSENILRPTTAVEIHSSEGTNGTMNGGTSSPKRPKSATSWKDKSNETAKCKLHPPLQIPKAKNEPKVMVPYKTEPGKTPRKIKIERCVFHITTMLTRAPGRRDYSWCKTSSSCYYKKASIIRPLAPRQAQHSIYRWKHSMIQHSILELRKNGSLSGYVPPISISHIYGIHISVSISQSG